MKSWWKFQIVSLRWISVNLPVQLFSFTISIWQKWCNYDSIMQMILLYNLTFPLYCICWGFLWGENPIDLRQTNTELGSSCYSTPTQDTHSTSLRTVTMQLYWTGPLVFRVSRKKKKSNTFKDFAQIETYMREVHFKGSETQQLTFFATILSPPLCSFLAMMRKVQREVAGFSCFVPIIYING